MTNRRALVALATALGQALRSLLLGGGAGRKHSAPSSAQGGRAARRTDRTIDASRNARTEPNTSRGTRSGSSAAHDAELALRRQLLRGDASPGQLGATATFEVIPPGPGALTIAYEPEADGAPDAGEVIWTWVPYAERDGRGKDRPALVISRADAVHVYVVRLTSKSQDGDRDFVPIGTGGWDGQGRPSWVDIEQLYLVHDEGMRREATAIDRERFDLVASALRTRYGW